MKAIGKVSLPETMSSVLARTVLNFNNADSDACNVITYILWS